MSDPFKSGQAAFFAGKPATANPYIAGTTKLGNPKFSDFESGSEWERGFISAKPARIASKAEIEAARAIDVSNFGRRYRK